MGFRGEGGQIDPPPPAQRIQVFKYPSRERVKTHQVEKNNPKHRTAKNSCSNYKSIKKAFKGVWHSSRCIKIATKPEGNSE